MIGVGMAQGGPTNPQQEAQQAVKLRKALFDVQSYSYSPMGASLRSGTFDAAAAVLAGQRIEMTSQLIPELFKFNTTKFNVQTKAREGIWTNMADFTQKAQNLHQAAENLVAAGKSGDQDMIRQAAIAVGKACGSCHDDYRNK